MKAKLILVGGFLGAGKTASIFRLARWLVKRRHRVAIITDDAPDQREVFAVDGISPNVCFCCRPDVLASTIRKRARLSRPDIIIAEVVGDHRKLIATVGRIVKIYKTEIESAPYSVLADPINMLGTLKLEPGRGFAPEVESILDSQLKEAEIVVLNKRDVFPPEKRQRVEGAIANEFPRAKICSISARSGEGCNKWFDLVLGKVSHRKSAGGRDNRKRILRK